MIKMLRKASVLIRTEALKPKAEIGLIYKDAESLTILLAHTDIFDIETKKIILKKILCEN